ncbi:CBS domain-containing protein [Anaerosoma tenue]|uniref:CBS domain-containing protein n=1 Tax=Anaerosoma tenue TaxID=2933588 RepID=UPI002260A059|nr:CBS domain-containing protein [Anaerosoma tenue]MCK8114110.1 CBS domain-containing protein [Anaerosoma tenue]
MSVRRVRQSAPVTGIAVGHANPDFDAYAAMVAATKLYEGTRAVYLGSQNANVREFHNLHEEFVPFVDLGTLDFDAIERVIMVDTREADRIGEIGSVVTRPGVEVIVYDHHPRQPGDVVPAEDHSMMVGATTSILTHEIHDRGIALTPLEASVLLLGIHEDTGSLTYPGTTAYDVEAVAFLMQAGAEIDVLNQFLARSLTTEQRAMLEQLVDSLETWEVNGQEIAVSVARSEEYVDSAAVLTHYIVEDLGYRVAVALIEMPERLQVVGRSRIPSVDMAAVLKHLDGGGHPQAASAALRDGTIEEARERLRDALTMEVVPPLTAEEIASSPVRWVPPETPMDEAGRIMATWGHSGLPVIDNGRLVGLVTRKDVDKAARHGLGHAPATGFMARQPVTVTPDTDLPELERLLVRTGIGRLPVVDGGEVVGIVTRKDLLRAQHGEMYLDRKMSRRHADAARTVLASIAHLPADAQEAVRTIGRMADEAGVRAHAVGGFVRDMLLGEPNLDIDIVVEGDGLTFALETGERLGKRVKVHRRFGTAVMVWSKDLHVDITSARTEYYQRPGALPTVERSSLRQDLFRRDFSINAMAVCVNPERFGQIADPFGGLSDLERGVVRALHSLSFVEDPTRVLRALRFEQKFGFRIDPSTDALLKQAVEMGMLDEVSGARLREELLDIIDEPDVAAILTRMAEVGALGSVGPETDDHTAAIADVAACASAYDTLAPRFEQPPRRRTLLVTAFIARAGRSSADRWCRKMRFGREYAGPAVLTAERREALTARLRDRRKMRPSRLYFLLESLPSETLAYLWATGEGRVTERVEEYVTVLSRVRPEVTGEDLIALGVEPGPPFAGILAQARADRLDKRAVGREAELANLKRLAKREAR